MKVVFGFRIVFVALPTRGHFVHRTIGRGREDMSNVVQVQVQIAIVQLLQSARALARVES